MVSLGGSFRIMFLLRNDNNMTEPMGLGLLSALAKQNRPHRETRMALLSDSNWLDAVRDYKPHVVAASSITGEHKHYLPALQAVKESLGRDAFVMLGGPYAYTYLRCIKQYEFLDATGVYECDEAWPQFLDTFENGGDIHAVSNILTRENWDQAVRTEVGENGELVPAVKPEFKRPRFGALDDLPFMDRKLITEGTSFIWKFKRSIMAGRGCPHRCTYCFEEQYNRSFADMGGKMLQRYSVERLLAELEELVRLYDTRYLKFYDDVFPTYFPQDRAWLEEFAEKYPKRIGLPFHLLTRADIVHRTPEVLHLLKKAGIQSITMSIESGNRWIRDREYVRDMTEGDMNFSFRLAESLGIETFANTILGCPAPRLPPPSDPTFDVAVAALAADIKKYHRLRKGGLTLELERVMAEAKAWFSTKEEQREFLHDFLTRLGLRSTQLDYDKESCRFNLELNVSFGEFPILFPYPGTSITKKLVERGYFDGNFDALHESYQNKSPLVGAFTEYEKSVQQNFALLTTFAMLFTGSRNWVMRALGKPIAWLCLEKFAYIESDWATWVYEKLYAWSKAYMHETRIYPMRKTWGERLLFFRQMFNLDWIKQLGHRQSEKSAVEMQPGRTLGGPPPV